jgi:proliferating cell nuclear antigen
MTENDHLEIDMESGGGGSSTAPTPTTGFHRRFQAPLMDIEVEHLSIPVIDYQAEMCMKSLSFSTMIQQLKGFSETVNIKCNEELIEFISDSSDTGSMTVEIPIDELVEFSIEEDCQLDMSFALSYLHQVCSYGKIIPQVQLKFHSDYPLLLEYVAGDGGSIKYFLAPKINDDA